MNGREELEDEGAGQDDHLAPRGSRPAGKVVPHLAAACVVKAEDTWVTREALAPELTGSTRFFLLTDSYLEELQSERGGTALPRLFRTCPDRERGEEGMTTTPWSSVRDGVPLWGVLNTWRFCLLQ